MALGTPTSVASINTTTNAASYASSSTSALAIDDLVVMFVDAHKQDSTNPDTPTVTTDNGGPTMSRVTGADNAWRPTGTNRGTAWVFVGKVTSTPTGAVTFTVDFGGTSQYGCEADVIQITGADVSGTALAAIVQSAITSGSGASSASITLSAAGNSANRPLAAFFHNSNADAITPRTNWTELNEFTHSSPTITFESQYRGDAFETTASASWGSNHIYGGTAVEIKAATTTTTNLTHTASVVALAGGAHALTVTMPETAQVLALAGGAHTLTINMPETSQVLALAGGADTLTTTMPQTAQEFALVGGTQTLIIFTQLSHTAAEFALAGSTGNTVTHDLFNGEAGGTGLVNIWGLGGDHHPETPLAHTAAEFALAGSTGNTLEFGLDNGAAGGTGQVLVWGLGGSHHPETPLAHTSTEFALNGGAHTLFVYTSLAHTAQEFALNGGVHTLLADTTLSHTASEVALIGSPATLQEIIRLSHTSNLVALAGATGTLSYDIPESASTVALTGATGVIGQSFTGQAVAGVFTITGGVETVDIVAPIDGSSTEWAKAERHRRVKYQIRRNR